MGTKKSKLIHGTPKRKLVWDNNQLDEETNMSKDICETDCCYAVKSASTGGEKKLKMILSKVEPRQKNRNTPQKRKVSPEIDCFIVNTPSPRKKKCSSEKANLSCTDYEGKETSACKPKKAKQVFTLTADSIDRIQKGQWLDTDAINLAQELLRGETHMAGFQPTTLAQALRFNEMRKPFVQVLFDKDRSHWICISSDAPQTRKVKIYDSLSLSEVTASIAKQTENIMGTKDVEYSFPAVQQQENYNDCGVFAIAYATHLARGHNPVGVTFNVKLMRGHLLSCLQKGKLTLFTQK